VQIAVNEARNRRRSAGRRAGLELRIVAEPATAARATAPSAQSETLEVQERRRLVDRLHGSARTTNS
jgi:DNA-directed RNA polymerase specialized sigma24 family protein